MPSSQTPAVSQQLAISLLRLLLSGTTFANVRVKAAEAATNKDKDQSFLLRELDLRQKQVLSLFAKSRYATTRKIADLLGIHSPTALNLCKKWIDNGFIIQEGTSNKSRRYELAEKWMGLLK